MCLAKAATKKDESEFQVFHSLDVPEKHGNCEALGLVRADKNYC